MVKGRRDTELGGKDERKEWMKVDKNTFVLSSLGNLSEEREKRHLLILLVEIYGTKFCF